MIRTEFTGPKVDLPERPVLAANSGGGKSQAGRPEDLPARKPPTPGEVDPADRFPRRERSSDLKDELFPIGTNLTPVTDWSRERAFLDGFKTSRPWISGQGDVWDDGRSLDLDQHGWVRTLQEEQVARTLLLVEQEGQYPAGQYVVLYDGKGNLVYGFDAVRDEAASIPGIDRINVEPSNSGIYLAITETDPEDSGDYIRNIRVIPPGFEDSFAEEIFHPTFLEKTAPYKVLRFTHWMKTNGSPLVNWNERPVVDSARFTGGTGVPIELLVTLSNRVAADPWFSIPHQATDEYIREFAGMVRESLHPDRRVFIEYSNEVWNPLFLQSDWVEQQAKALWPDTEESDFTKRINWYGMRSAQTCDIWKEVWGASSQRVVCILSSQAVNPWTATTALECPLWSEAPCIDHGVDALGIAPYFGDYIGLPAVEEEVVHWTLEEDAGYSKLFQELTVGGLLSNSPPGGALQQAYRSMESSKRVALFHGIDLVAYEGGQHLAGTWGVENNAAVNRLFQAANRDPRMGQIYTDYLARWGRIGGGLYVNFTNVSAYTKWGSWGALEFLNQTSTPKFDALMRRIAVR
ncbi:MAG: cellulose-binding protein [Acidobacteriota bacterium]|nr:MAG: cellulose-binding protein [Acidobacteriota bacterium]